MVIILLTSMDHQAIAHEIPSKAATALKQLDKYSGGTLETKWNPTINTPTTLTGALTPPSKHTPEWIALEFLTRWKAIYGLQNPKRDLKVDAVERFDDRIAVHLRHHLFQTPVWEDKLVVVLNNVGVIEKIEGTIHPQLEKRLFNRPMHPAISKKQALNKAIERNQGELSIEPQVEIYYLAARPGTPLVYVVTLESRKSDTKTTTIIHALSGRIIEPTSH